MGSQQTLHAAMAQNGGLTIVGPDGGAGTGQVMLSFVRNQQTNELTAIIAFGGFNQALVTFDAYGTAPVSYSLYNPAPNQFIEQSVQNIVQQLSGYIPQM